MHNGLTVLGPYGGMLCIPPTNFHLPAAQQNKKAQLFIKMLSIY